MVPMPEQSDATGPEVGANLGAEVAAASELDQNGMPGIDSGSPSGGPSSSLTRPIADTTFPAESTAPAETGRPPQQVLEGLWAFAPNRDCQGGTAWWLEHAKALS